MAATNIKNYGKFEQKRCISVGVFDVTYEDIAVTDGSAVSSVPPGSLITAAYLVEKTAANIGATFDLTVGGTTVVDEGALDSTGSVTTVVTDATTGGDLIIKSGATAPTQGTFRLIVEYIEYNKTTGEYTSV